VGQERNGYHSVNGTVQDAESHTPLQFVTVTFKDINSGEVAGDVTNKSGQFELTVAEGKYYCIVESLSFKPFIIDVINIQQETDMGIIELEQNVENLDEIELVASANLMDRNLTKKVYNASKDIANVGGNAVTVLENTPSVRVDDQGNISIRGNTALVLVDGKPYGGQRSNADILSLIPANSISKVEIISQSAKYDSEGGGGILNIVLKKRSSEGYNGTVEAHVGKPDNDGVSSFINYRTEKVNIFSTVSFNHQVRLKDTDIQQIFLDDGQVPTGNFEQIRTDYKQRNSFLFNLGSDFFIDEKNTITTSIMYTSSNKNYDAELFLDDFRPFDELVRTSTRDVNEDTDETFLEAYMQYTTKFTKKGHQLSAEVKYDNSTAANDTDILNTETFPAETVTRQQYVKDENADNIYFRLDYSLPMGESSKFETGFKSNFRIYENDFLSSNLNPGAKLFDIIPDFSSRISYDERITAFYMNYGQEFERISFSAGLRLEMTRTVIEESNVGDDFENDYNDLFPSALVTYSMKDQNFFSIGYARYIDRPTIAQLNPFNSFANERFILLGNPFLQPYYTNYFYLEYYHEFEKLSLNSAIFYSNSTDRIMNVLENTGGKTPDGFDIYTQIPANNGTLNFMGLELEAMYNPSNKIRLYGIISPYYSELSDTRDLAYDFNNWVLYGNFRFLFKVTNTFRFNIDYIYQSAQKTAITELEQFNYVNLSISKDFLDGKSTLTFRANDLLYTKKARFNSLEANTITNRNFIYDTQFLLSFSYRFNKAGRKNDHNRSKDLDKNVFEIEDQIK
jgi:hypothetical protein